MAANPFNVLLRAIPCACDAGNHRCTEVAMVADLSDSDGFLPEAA